MKVRSLVSAVLFVAAVSAGRADAHFLFIRILPPAEGGRAART
jgi:hypothetical protein